MSQAIPETIVQNTNYFRLKAVGLKRVEEEAFSELAFENGAEGVAEDLSFEQIDLVYEPNIVETEILDLNIYFSTLPEENLLLKFQSAFPKAIFEMHHEENRDWMHEWKKGFKPFLFADPFWIVPSWFEPPAEIAHDLSRALFVDPGMAFGTGTHETTRLAATFLIEELKRKPAESLIDVGCGTAVLALVALRLGVKRVIGLDNDPEARRTARENLAHNHATKIQIPETSIQKEKGEFDVVVANIIDGVLTMLAHDLVRVLKPGGRMILSGVLKEREADFYANFASLTGLKMVKSANDNEWSAAILEKLS